MRALRILLRWTLRIVVALIVVALIVVGAGIGFVESAWGKNQLRTLLVRQANQYLTATLEIGQLQGSLFRGLELDDVRLARDGRAIVTIDAVAVSYSPRELWQKGVVIRRIHVTRPRVVGEKQADGRWNLGALVKRDARQAERTGPARPIEIQAIEVVDGDVLLRDAVQFGAAHLPSQFSAINASLSYAYAPVHWTLTFHDLSWTGRDPNLRVNQLTGRLGQSPEGWRFDGFSVATPRSAFVLDGLIATGKHPTEFDLAVHADRFAFQEWSGILHGLSNIAVESSFDARLTGPTTALAADLNLNGTGGRVAGRLTLDTSVPGWHGSGTVDVARLNLARWLNRADRPSDVTGRVAFDLDLDFGGKFPRGTYRFDGPHAMYMNYAADDLHARGHITRTAVEIEAADGVAYGSTLRSTTGSIALDSPFPYRFAGTLSGLDLRGLPREVPVPHVASTLAFAYDVNGTFVDPFIVGRAMFHPSEFLGAGIGEGTVGSIDTSVRPMRYAGEGDVAGMNLRRLGEGLDVAWLQDPRYAGIISGHFRVNGSGSNQQELSLTGGGRITRATVFGGALTNADINLTIENGTLAASYNGQLATVDPAIPLATDKYAGSLTGSADVRVRIEDFFTRSPTLVDYDVSGSANLRESVIRGLRLDSLAAAGSLIEGRLSLMSARVGGPAIAGTGSGTIALDDRGLTDFQYDITRADLAALQDATGAQMKGMVTTSGRLTGPPRALHASGQLNASNIDAFGVSALTLNAQYETDVNNVLDEMPEVSGRVNGRTSFMTIFGRTIEDTSGTVAIAGRRVDFDLTAASGGAEVGRLTGAATLHADRHGIDLLALTADVGATPWRLADSTTPPIVTWSDQGLAITAATFVAGAAGDQRLAVDGAWRRDGTGALQVHASHVFLESFQKVQQPQARLGGQLDADVTVRGTADALAASGTMTIVNGRVDRVSFDKLTGRVGYANETVDVDLRLDQASGVWLTANGKVPVALVDASRPDRPMDVSIVSSPIDFGLIEGVTNRIARATGRARIDLHATGTARNPSIAGSAELVNASFVVPDTGAVYKNARASLQFAGDRVVVDAIHLEDRDGHPLDMSGSLGARSLSEDVSVDITMRGFEVLRDTLGRVVLDSRLQLRGTLNRPRLTGDASLAGNANINVEQVLEQTLFRPYATAPAGVQTADVVSALNPWDRLAIDMTVHVAGSRLTGSNVQIASGTPIGLSDINLRVGGDLYLYKDAMQPLYITGSLYEISGRYAFQGRTFTIDESQSSINFTGDRDPQLYLVVKRVISGVETRVTISGELRQPELRLASTPQLDESDILSLIVFNAAPSDLSATQQRELAVRAGAIAAGFVAAPLLSAIKSDLGLEAFDIEPASGLDASGGKITVGEEIAPGLVARFSRQFGTDPFDEATVEYYLSQLFRIRATFSDAQQLTAREPFRRTERAGIDFLVFLSF